MQSPICKHQWGLSFLAKMASPMQFLIPGLGVANARSGHLSGTVWEKKVELSLKCLGSQGTIKYNHLFSVNFHLDLSVLSSVQLLQERRIYRLQEREREREREREMS